MTRHVEEGLGTDPRNKTRQLAYEHEVSYGTIHRVHYKDLGYSSFSQKRVLDNLIEQQKEISVEMAGPMVAML